MIRNPILILAAAACIASNGIQAQSGLDSCNVIWDTPSLDGSGSMPLGNGDIGLNVWVEEKGDILFLIGKTDAFDENAALVKLGRVRVRLSPNPFESGVSFSQTLKLRKSEIEIRSGDRIRIRIWVDANHPVIHLETQGRETFLQSVSLESWRREKTRMAETQVSDLFKNLTGPDPHETWVFPDRSVRLADRIALYHHNVKPEFDGYETNMVLQGAGDFARENPHPLLGNVFGSMLTGTGFVPVDSIMIRSGKASDNHHVEIFCLTQQRSGPDLWLEEMDRLIEDYHSLDPDQLRLQHERWWESFWARSWVEISSTGSDADSVQDLSRAYALCRYMNAAAGRGKFPIKFNGSIFTYGKEGNPDYRRWGGPGFWFQNQRLVYWPMPAQGDFDLMQPWFALYRDALPLAEHRTRTAFGHRGAHFPETITPWGSSVSGHYGWTPFEERKNKSDECTYITYLWQSGIEMLLMMCTAFEYTEDLDFAKKILIPHAEAVSRFYDEHYLLDNRGKMHIGPAQSLETYQVAVNPMPEVAGLQYTLNRLLSLPDGIASAEQRARWNALLDQLPRIPTGMREGRRSLLFAESWGMKMNVENPELYAVFPYRIFGIGKDSLEIARNAFELRVHREDLCWYQNAVDAALLGLKSEAREMILKRAAPERHSDSRFPAFWNAFNDWIPDVDHGGNLQMALNYMLLQCEGKEIRILPCWPEEWDVHFKLHAPYRTTVECVYRKGRIERLIVIPKERAGDVLYR